MTSPPPPHPTSPGGEARPGWALAEAGGRIVAADARFAELTGAAATDAVIGRSWPALLAAAEAPRVEEALRSIATGRPWRDTLQLAAAAPAATVDLALYPAATREAGPPEGAMVVLQAMEPALPPTSQEVDPQARVVALEAVAESRSAEAAARAVLQELHHAVAFDWAAVLRLDADGADRAEVVAVFPSPMAGLGPGSTWSPLDPTEAALARAGTPSLEGWLQPAPEDRSPLARLPAFGLISALRVPLYAGAEVVGGVLPFRAARSAFTPDDGLHTERLARPLGRRLAELPLGAPSPAAALEAAAPAAGAVEAPPAVGTPPAVETPGSAEGGPPSAIEPTFSGQAPPPPEGPAPDAAALPLETVETPEPTLPPAAERALTFDAERLAALGDFVAGVAHELNSPLTSIAGWAQLLPELPEDDRDAALGTIEREALRLGRIVQNLLYFSRRQPPGRERVDLNGLLRRIAEVRGDELASEGIELALQLGQAPAVLGDEYQLELVLLNLIGNAEEALKPGGGRITVTSETEGGSARVTVTDTGPGIPAEVLPRVFEPFFTTRDIGQGTGLGLSIAYGIVSEHGGELHAESPPEGGARFVVELRLPRDDQPAAPTATVAAAAPALARERARVLVVDAEPAMRALLREVLVDAGYEVMTAETEGAALELVTEYSADLLVVDAALLEPAAGRLLWALDELRPELRSRALLLAGAEHEEHAAELAARGAGLVLAKPFDVDALLDAVRRVLGGEPG